MKICPQCLKQYGDDQLDRCPEDDTQLRLFNEGGTNLIGRVLDQRWMIEEKIGEGGMGEVFRGRQMSVDRPVAIKVLRPAMAVSEEYVKRFFREANLASQINHPNFVTIYDFGQAADMQILYLAMEFLDGIDLADRIGQGQMSLDHILEISLQIGAALVAAHDLNIVHRDLKPENVFLVDDVPGQVNLKVLDFGIAKEIGTANSMTKTGQIFGTPEYMSPEQCQSRTEVDGRSDLYSLGCMLYELISGVSPFHRDTVIQTLLAQVTDKPRDIREFGFFIPDQTANMVMRLLEKDPADRYQTAEEACAAFQYELGRLRSQPSELSGYIDSMRSTTEFDRRINSSAETAALEPRQASQLINLHSYQHLQSLEEKEEEAAEVKRRGWIPVVGLIGLLAISGGVYAGTQELDWNGEGANSDVGPALDAARKAVGDGGHAAGSSVATKYSEQLGRGTVILATSMAIAGPGEPPASKRTSRKTKTTKSKRPAALLGVRTKSSVEHQAKKYTRKLIGCYSNRENPEDAGAVSFSFRIQGDGGVDRVTITKSTLESKSVQSCIEKKIKKWKFAADPDGASMNHARTVTFRHK